MKVFVALTALLQIVYCGHVSVRLPYLNPAGVTYVNGYQGHGADLAYSAEVAPLPAAKIEAHHVGYAAAQIPALAAVPFIKHVPTVSQIPVTTVQHHPAVIEKQIDVLKPAISTKKFEVRRPAIEKKFYDIEQRVIIRPAGSALVELPEPTSKVQKGPTIVQPLSENGFLFHAHQASLSGFEGAAISTTASPIVSSTFASPVEEEKEESVVVDNADFRSAAFRNVQQNSQQQIQQQNQQQQLLQQQNLQFGQRINQQQQLQRDYQSEYSQQQQIQQQQIQQQQIQQQQQLQRDYQNDYSQQQQQQQLQQHQQIQQQQQIQRDYQSQISRQQIQEQNLIPNSQLSSNQIPGSESHNFPLEEYVSQLAFQNRGASIVPSLQSSPQESQLNQKKLIDLYSANGGVTEIGHYNPPEKTPTNARVLSASSESQEADAREHVSTKRVVVSRPIETLQEYNVFEPTKQLHRIAVQQPTFVKSARLDNVQVHGSVPVIGKALTPTFAHAAIPVYQKTISAV